MSVLRGELVLVGHNGRKLCQVTLNRQEHESALCIELPIDPKTGRTTHFSKLVRRRLLSVFCDF